MSAWLSRYGSAHRLELPPGGTRRADPPPVRHPNWVGSDEHAGPHCV